MKRYRSISQILLSELCYIIIALIVLMCPADLQAQDPNAGTSIERRPDFITFVDVGVGSTALLEVGISARVRNRLATGFFYQKFHSESTPLNNMDSEDIFGIKAKFYENDSPNSLYLGPLLGAHGGNGFRPFIGATVGFDHFSRLLFLKERIELRMGIEVQAGLDTEGEGFTGIGVSIGFGWSNQHLINTKRQF